MEYQQELGQMFFGNPSGDYELPGHAHAMLAYIVKEIKRVYWNNNQEQWDEENPGLGGIEYRRYYWGDDELESAKPNFKFKDVEVRWYKHFGRGMSTNVQKSPDEWVRWFNECLELVRSYDTV
jgi:hypothetical protein